jgi:hypothetical protein
MQCKQKECLQTNLSSTGNDGRRYCMDRKTAPGTTIIARSPPVIGPITSFVACNGLGSVHPLSMIYAYSEMLANDVCMKVKMTNMLYACRNPIRRLNTIRMKSDLCIQQSKRPRIDNTYPRRHFRMHCYTDG